MQETWVQPLDKEDPLEKALGWEYPLREGNDNPLQYSCMENPMDRGACF